MRFPTSRKIWSARLLKLPRGRDGRADSLPTPAHVIRAFHRSRTTAVRHSRRSRWLAGRIAMSQGRSIAMPRQHAKLMAGFREPFEAAECRLRWRKGASWLCQCCPIGANPMVRWSLEMPRWLLGRQVIHLPPPYPSFSRFSKRSGRRSCKHGQSHRRVLRCQAPSSKACYPVAWYPADCSRHRRIPASAAPFHKP